MYQIVAENDFQTGYKLVVRVPEIDVDKTALYTIINEKPSFILPFKYCVIDEEVEFTYLVEHRAKLKHMRARNTVNDCVDLWIELLQPLLDSKEWFLDTAAFVLDAGNIYYDTKINKASYIYIPTIKPHSTVEMLKEMIMEISNDNETDDLVFQNKVLKEIQKFSLKGFLEEMKSCKTNVQQERIIQQERIVEPQASYVVDALPMMKEGDSIIAESPSKGMGAIKFGKGTKEPKPEKAPKAEKKGLFGKGKKEKEEALNLDMEFLGEENFQDDINISFGGDFDAPKGKKEKKKLFGSKEKAEKPAKTKATKPLFGKKKTAEVNDFVSDEIDMSGFGMSAAPMQHNISQPVMATPIAISQPSMVTEQIGVDDDVTVINMDFMQNGVRFRYIGSGTFDPVIPIVVAEGGMFVIGRFDVSVGRKQCDFEFDKNKKAISRRHVVLERTATGYNITDLSSAGGTYLDGQKLPPNAPFALKNGNRVSFGNSGADYIFEE